MVVNRRGALQVGLGAFAVVVGFFAVGQLVPGVRQTYTHVAGVHGSVTVVRCDERTYDGPATFTCHGRFTADDASVKIPLVRLRPDLGTRPTGAVAARVAGSGADDALVDGRFTWATQLIGGLVFGAFAIGVGAALVRMVRNRSSVP